MNEQHKMFDALNEICNGLEILADGAMDSNVNDVTQMLIDIRNLDESLAYLKKKYGALHKRYKEEIVPKKFEEEGVTSITVDGHRFTVSHQARTSIISDQKSAAYDWLNDNGLGDLITNTVNASTLSAAAKHLAEDGVDMPDELFKVHSFDNTSVTKVK